MSTHFLFRALNLLSTFHYHGSDDVSQARAEYLPPRNLAWYGRVFDRGQLLNRRTPNKDYNKLFGANNVSVSEQLSLLADTTK